MITFMLNAAAPHEATVNTFAENILYRVDISTRGVQEPTDVARGVGILPTPFSGQRNVVAS